MLPARLTLLGALLAGAALAQSSPSQRPASPPASARDAGPQDDVVVEDVWISMAEVPDDYFTRAQSKFSRDREAAAKDLRKAAAVIELQSEHAAEGSRQALKDSAKEVRTLARGVEKGTVRSAKELGKPIARAEYALAHNHQLRAEEAWSAKEEARAGHELRATANYLERGARWSGRESERGVKAAVQGTRKLGGDLVKGVSHVPEEVRDGIALAGKEVQRLGTWVRPSSGESQQGTGGSGTGADTPAEEPEKTR